MNPALIRMCIVAVMIFLLSIGGLGYVFLSQRVVGERLVSFKENIEAWDVLNRANVMLSTDDVEGIPASEILHALVLKGEGDTIAFLAHVDELGRQTGVAISTNELKSIKTPEAGFDQIAATVTLRGLPGDVEKMIALLENLPYRSHIETLTLSRLNEAAEAVVEIRVSIVK